LEKKRKKRKQKATKKKKKKNRHNNRKKKSQTNSETPPIGQVNLVPVEHISITPAVEEIRLTPPSEEEISDNSVEEPMTVHINTTDSSLDSNEPTVMHGNLITKFARSIYTTDGKVRGLFVANNTAEQPIDVDADGQKKTSDSLEEATSISSSPVDHQARSSNEATPTSHTEASDSAAEEQHARNIKQHPHSFKSVWYNLVNARIPLPTFRHHNSTATTPLDEPRIGIIDGIEEAELEQSTPQLSTSASRPKVAEKSAQKSNSTFDSTESRLCTLSDRQNWDQIRAICDLSLRKLVASHFRAPDGKPMDLGRIYVLCRTEGSYHHVVFMGLRTPEGLDEYVIRIPAHGTEEEWKDEDRIMLDNEARLMRYIKEHTDVPVPEIIDWEDTVWNTIGAPYIMMKKIPGRSAFSFWYMDQTCNLDDDLYLAADYPSKELEEKRARFLRSLAQHMAELGKIQITQIGMPTFQESGNTFTHPKAGPRYKWFPGEPWGYEKHGPYSTTQECIQDRLEYIDMSVEDGIKDGIVTEESLTRQMRGKVKFLKIVFSPEIFPHLGNRTSYLTRKETFTIHHNDLDLQNILVDEEGNITGIIDWDGCMAAPRCAGSAAVPKFLSSDWFPNQDFDRLPHMPWKLEAYRKQYAAYLSEFGCADAAKYTEKSAMYQAAIHAITVSLDFDDLVSKVVTTIPALHGIDPDKLLRTLGRGWPGMENLLRKEIKHLFAPSDPNDMSDCLDLELMSAVNDAHYVIDKLARLKPYRP
jgi:hypothetical protein